MVPHADNVSPKRKSGIEKAMKGSANYSNCWGMILTLADARIDELSYSRIVDHFGSDVLLLS